MNTTFYRILWKGNKNKINYPDVKKVLINNGYTIESYSRQCKISATKPINNNHRFHFTIEKPVYSKIINCGINLHKDIEVGVKNIEHVALEDGDDIRIELAKFALELNKLILKKRKIQEYEDLIFKFRWY